MNSSASASSSNKKKNEAADQDGDGGELSTFAKAAGVVAGIAAVGVGIAGLFSAFSKDQDGDGGELSTFAKAAGVVAGIAAVGVGIAGLFSAFSKASAAVAEPSNISSIQNNESNTFVSNSTADGKVMVRWVPPPEYWVKINTDGASQCNPGNAGMGGLIRDSSGAWKVGFMKPLGVLGSTEAELKAIEAGLQLALNEGYRRVLLETDSQPALDYINGSVRRFISDDLFSLVANIKELIERFSGCELSRVPREANKCADSLANMGIQGRSYPCIRSPPEPLLKHLQADMEGKMFPRR